MNDNETTESLLEAGKAFVRRGKYAEALRVLQAALSREPSRADIMFEIGKAHKGRGEFRRAAEFLEKAERGGIPGRGIAKELGEVYHVLGEHDRACRKLEEELGENPGEAWLPVRLGVLYRQRGDTEKALAMFLRARDRGLDIYDIHKGLGEIWCEQGNWDAAMDEFEKALQCRQDDLPVLLRLLELYMAGRHYARAIAVLGEQVRGGNAHAPVYRCLGESRLMRGEYAAAVEAFEQALRGDPGDMLTRVKLGEAYLRLGRHDRAREVIGTAYAQKKWSPEIHRKLGELYDAQERYDLAAKQFERVLAMTPDDASAAFALGRIHARNRDYRRAKKMYQTALRHGLSNFETHFELGTVLLRENRHHLAAQEFDAAAGTASPPHDAEAEKRRGDGPGIAGGGQERGSEAFRCRRLPRELLVSLTSGCNLRCIMCNIVKENHPPLPEKAFDKLRPLLPHLNKITWQGGEIFLVGYFRELLCRLKKEYPAVRHSINTNGLLIDAEWARTLARLDVELIFSIDGVSKDLYESIRVGGSHERLLANLALLNESYAKGSSLPPSFSIVTVVMQRNMPELELFPAFCRKSGIRYLRFMLLEHSVLVPDEVPRLGMHGGPGSDRATLSGIIGRVQGACAAEGIDFRCDFESLLEKERANGRDPRTPPTSKVDGSDGPGTAPLPGSGATAAERLTAGNGGIPPGGPRGTGKEVRYCTRPWDSLFLEAEGTLKPWCECTIPVGNIIEGSLDDAWNGEIMRAYRRRLREGRYRGWCSRRCVNYLRDSTALSSHPPEGKAE